MHQSFFIPPSQTVNKAANNNQLQGIPYLTSPKITKTCVASSPETSKGQLKKNKEQIYAHRNQRRREVLT